MTGARGFIGWTPSRKTRVLLGLVQEVLAQYAEYLPLTIRQIFYRLVAQYGYPKTELDYKRLCRTTAKARRARLIPFSSIRDDGVMRLSAGGFQGISDFESILRSAADSYALHRAIGQQNRIIVLCEASGMAPQLASVANAYGADVQSSGGFEGLQPKYDLAKRIVLDAEKRQDTLSIPKTTLLHIGDHDPSGVCMFDVIRDDVGAFVEQLAAGADVWVSFEAVRIAVTEQQIAGYALPTAPAKDTDSRSKTFRGETVQCEALPPDILNQILEVAIAARIDAAALTTILDREAAERALIQQALTELSFGGAV
jgi:hypothetical protein